MNFTPFYGIFKTGDEYMKRLFYEELIDWKKNHMEKPLMLLGVRQCGKTYLIRKFIEKNFKNYKEINLLEDEDVVNLYKQNINSEEKFIKLKTLLDFDIEASDSILFIDEIQVSEELISDLKFFQENHENVNIICAGSLLGVKLKRFNKSFPVGKVWLKKMYPMNFKEFLIAFKEQKLIEEIEKCFNNNQNMVDPLHHKLNEYYKLYLITGGMPESVKNIIEMKKDISKYNRDILSSIVESYFNDMQKYVQNPKETLKIRSIYSSISSQLSNNSKKFQYSKVQKGAKSREYELPLDWLLASNCAIKSNSVSKPSIPLEGYKNKDIFKIYLSDVGILSYQLRVNYSDILLDRLDDYKGVIAENYVANELISNGHNLYYWLSEGKAEIDFLLYNEDGIIPIEVKAGDNTQSKSLKVYMDKFNPPYAVRLSTKNFGYNPKTKIKSIPLYAAFLLK